MKKALLVILSTALVMGSLSGCGGSKSSSASAPAPNTPSSSDVAPVAITDQGSGDLRLYVSEDIETLNSHIYKASQTREFIMEICGALYRIKPSTSGGVYEIVAEFADGEPKMMDADGKVWQIKVLDNAKWANGEPLTAADFEYSLKMLFDPKLLNHRSAVLEESNVFILNANKYFAQVANKETVDWSEVGVKLLDGNILELTLEKPVTEAFLKYCFAGSTTLPVYRKLYEGGMNAEGTETNYGTSVDKFVSSGPFMITEWAKGSSYKCVKNPNYPLKEQISLASIGYTVIPESGTAMQLFESGQLDYISLPVSSLDQYGDDPRIIEVPAKSAVCVGINTISEANPILKNQKFRQALYYATNRPEIAKLLKAQPAPYFITDDYIADIETGLAYRDMPSAKAILPANDGYDPTRAKALFEEALKETGVSKVTLEIIYQDSGTSRKAATEYLQSSFVELFGTDKLTIKLQAVPSSQLSERLRDHINNPSSFDLGWISTSYNLLDPSSALMEWEKNANRKKIPYYDDEFTALYDEIKHLPLADVQKRGDLTAKAEGILLDDAPFTPVYRDISYVLIADRVKLAIEKYNGVTEFGWCWASIAG